MEAGCATEGQLRITSSVGRNVSLVRIVIEKTEFRGRMSDVDAYPALHLRLRAGLS